MTREYTSLGLMSGTSIDGVDASIIKSDGQSSYSLILNKYFKFDKETYDKIHSIKDKINSSKDLKILSKEINDLEKKITLFHAKVVKELNYNDIELIGFHGQTIFHNSEEKISIQLGNGQLLSQLTNKDVVYNFRQNDLKNGGEGAPITPVFHNLLVKEKDIGLPVSILNIGGISNITSINVDDKIFSQDVGPGSCLIDHWIRLNTDKTFDDGGKIAMGGKISKIILDQSLDNYFNSNISKKRSYDTKDFDLSFVRGLSLVDGAATLTEFTAQIICNKKMNKNIYICGGGRKNKFLLNRIEKITNNKVKLIDELDIDGDFVESQAFGYLAIRSYLKLPLTFPETTGVKKACIGGEIIKIK